MNILLDVLAYNTHYLGFNANMLANEMFLDSTSLRSSAVSHAKMLGYEVSSPRAAKAILSIFPLDSFIESPIQRMEFDGKPEELNEVHKEMIKFIKNLQNIYPQDIIKAFVDLHLKLKAFEDDPYERRAFLYLDILSWLESKIKNLSLIHI